MRTMSSFLRVFFSPSSLSSFHFDTVVVVVLDFRVKRINGEAAAEPYQSAKLNICRFEAHNGTVRTSVGGVRHLYYERNMNHVSEFRVKRNECVYAKIL